MKKRKTKSKINKRDHDYYGFNTEKISGHFEGDLTYLNTFCVKGTYKPVAVFSNSNPNRKKDHKDYMLLWIEGIEEKVIISGMNKKEMNKYRYQTGILCPKCKEIIYSTYRHDYRHCSCGRCMIDGGKDYVKTNLAGKLVKIDLLTDKIEFGVFKNGKNKR
jgi:hypothetical protein